MASKINNLPAVSSPLSTDITNIVNSPFVPGDDKKITMANFLNLVNVVGFTASGVTAATATNSAGISFTIPLNPIDATDHSWVFSITGNSLVEQQFIKIFATGDGNGGIIDSELDLNGPINITSDLVEINPISEPSAPTIALAASPGNVPNGTYTYKVLYKTVNGYTTLLSAASNSITILDHTQFGQIAVDLPISPNPAVVQRDLYRNDGGGYKLVASILNNSDLQYLDDNVSASGNPPLANNTGNLEITQGDLLVDEGNIEANYIITSAVSVPTETVASANDLPLGRTVVNITGSVTINAILNAVTGAPGRKTLWSSGDIVTINFSGNPLLKNNTAGGAGTSKIMLAGGADFPMSGNAFGSGTIMKFLYDGTQWQEISRSVNHA